MKLTLNKEEMRHLYNIEHYINKQHNDDTNISMCYKLYNLCCILDDNDVVELVINQEEVKRITKDCIDYEFEMTDLHMNELTIVIMQKCKKLLNKIDN